MKLEILRESMNKYEGDAGGGLGGGEGTPASEGATEDVSTPEGTTEDVATPDENNVDDLFKSEEESTENKEEESTENKEINPFDKIRADMGIDLSDDEIKEMLSPKKDKPLTREEFDAQERINELESKLNKFEDKSNNEQRKITEEMQKNKFNEGLYGKINNVTQEQKDYISNVTRNLDFTDKLNSELYSLVIKSARNIVPTTSVGMAKGVSGIDENSNVDIQRTMNERRSSTQEKMKAMGLL